MSGGDSTDLSLSPVGEALRVCVSGRLGVWWARGLFVSKLHLKFGDELSDSQSLSLFVCVCVCVCSAGRRCHRSCNGRCWGHQEDQCQTCEYAHTP